MNGCDLSMFQGAVDFNTLKQHVDFAIIKTTEGVDWVDPKFGDNRQAARATGILRGYYHFARFDSTDRVSGVRYNNTPEDEAQHFINLVATPGALQPGEILVLDFEVIPAGDMTDRVSRFCNYVYEKTGLRPWVYSYRAILNALREFGPYAVWVADPDHPYEPYGSVNVKWDYVCQQYGTDNIPGVEKNPTDVNHFFGNKDYFKSFGLPEPTAPEPAPEPIPDPPITEPLNPLPTEPTPEPKPVPTPKPLPQPQPVKKRLGLLARFWNAILYFLDIKVKKP